MTANVTGKKASIEEQPCENFCNESNVSNERDFRNSFRQRDGGSKAATYSDPDAHDRYSQRDCIRFGLRVEDNGGVLRTLCDCFAGRDGYG